MSGPLRVLIVEDSEDDAALLVRQLRQGGYEPQFERVDTPEAMNAALDAKVWEVVIADYALPRFSAPAALEILRQRRLDLPFIIVSGVIGEETAVAAMKAGAHDYIMKDNLARLVPAIERELREAQVRRERRRAEEELAEKTRLTQLLLDALPCVALLLRRDREIVYSNQAAVNVGAVPGAKCYATWARRDDPCPWCLARDALDAGESKQVEVEAGGIVWDAHWIPLGPDLYLHYAFDITERKRAEKQLRDSLQTSADIVEAIPSGLFIYRYEEPDRLVLLHGNPEAERLTGITAARWRGREFNEIWPKAREAGLAKAFLDVMRTGKTFQVEDYHYKDDRIDACYRIRAFRMPGNRLGVAFEDVTERKRAEEAERDRASLQELSRQIIRTQEEERRRLSRELHDEAGQALTAIKLNTELLAVRMPADLPDLRRLARDTAKVTAGLIDEMRRIAAALRPAILDDLGLLPTLRWYAKNVERRYGLRVRLVNEGLESRLEPDFEVTLYRIVQEALTNVVRHAQAEHATVKLSRRSRGLELLIADDGQGMDAAAARLGAGLTGIRERAHLFGGRMDLQSEPSKGTILRVIFPSMPRAK